MSNLALKSYSRPKGHDAPAETTCEVQTSSTAVAVNTAGSGGSIRALQPKPTIGEPKGHDENTPQDAESSPVSNPSDQSLQTHVPTKSSSSRIKRICCFPWVLLGRFLRMLLLSVAYVPFVYTVLLQSFFTRRPLDPKYYRTDMKGWAFIAGIVLFSTLLGLTFAQLAFIRKSLEAVIVLSTILSLIFITHLMTIDYAHRRRGLRTVSRNPNRKYHYFCGRRTSISFTYWRNLLPLANVPIEYLQLVGLVLYVGHEKVGTPSTVEKTLRDILLQVNIDFSQEVTFYLTITGVGLYCLLCGYFIETERTEAYWMSPVLFEFWSGTLYLTIYSRTLRLVFYSTSNFRHVVGLLFLLYYASTSVFVGVYRADEKSLKCDVRYIPKFLVVERVMKEVMAFFAVAYQDEPIVALPALLGLEIFYLVVVLRMRPCVYRKINSLRAAFISCAIVVTVLCIFSHATPWDYSTVATIATVSTLPVLAFIIIMTWRTKAKNGVTRRGSTYSFVHRFSMVSESSRAFTSNANLSPERSDTVTLTIQSPNSPPRSISNLDRNSQNSIPLFTFVSSEKFPERKVPVASTVMDGSSIAF